MNQQAVTKTHQQTTTVTPVTSGILQRKCACGQQTITGGECAECNKSRLPLQRRATSQAGSSPPPTLSAAPSSQNQIPRSAIHTSAGSHLGSDFSQVRVSNNEQQENRPCVTRGEQAKGGGQGSSHNQPRTLDEIGQQLSAASQPIDSRTRSFMEDRFGADFSGVRVHTNQEAQLAADVLRAEAFTIGTHIFFARGRFNPETTEGKFLLAHERRVGDVVRPDKRF